MANIKKYLAECIGTFTLVLCGCGVAAATSEVNPAAFWVATSLAFGLSIVAMAYCIGKISGCHVNPAVSLAMAINKKLSWKDFFFYFIFQLLGAGLACLVLALIFGDFAHFGANFVQKPITEAYESEFVPLLVGLVAEIVLTFIFLLAIFGATHKAKDSDADFNGAGIVIGGALTLVHLLGLYITGTSVNPARSIMPAIFTAFSGEYTPLIQMWIFIAGPFIGAALAAIVWKLFTKENHGSELA